MHYLKDLPVQELKIPMPFIADMTVNSTSATIVRASIELAHGLGIRVVAEGVETARVWDLLTEIGCDLAQGYYLAKPLPANELDMWLTSRNKQSVGSHPVSVDC